MSAVGYENAWLAPTKYLWFERLPEKRGRKTAIWQVISQSSGSPLGRIAWYGPWRQYVFEPWNDTLYNVDCLAEIADRVATCNRWHRNIRANLSSCVTK